MKHTVFSVTNTVTPQQSCTNVFYSFILDKEYGEMEIRFSYIPKVHGNDEQALEIIRSAMPRFAPPPYDNAYGRAEDYLPIVNLLTVSLDDPSGYRGCAHRHDNSQVHFINPLFASPGFYKGKINAGEWRIGVNLHCVVTNSCTYSLEVLAGEEEST